MKRHTFELKVIPKTDGDYRLELWEPPPPDSRPEKGRRSRPLSHVEGWYLNLCDAVLRRALENNGYKLSEVKRTRRVAFRLDEEDGVRLDLAFHAIQGLRQRTRIDDILHGINDMSREEALYWHAKITHNNGTRTENGIVALRVLLGGQTH